MFKVGDFFDLAGFEHAKIFDSLEYPWEALPKIKDFVKAQARSTLNQNKYGSGLSRTDLRSGTGTNILIGKGTVVEQGALIKSNVIIGKNCRIGHAAYLRENCLIGDNVTIGHGSEIKNSIILNDTAVAHLNYVGDSLVGSKVNIAGGALLANFRFDGKEILIKQKGEVINTGLVKLGAIIGDGSQIGVNAILNPGTILGKNCIIYPLTSVLGVHKDNEIIR